jgi:hypothetical protein
MLINRLTNDPMKEDHLLICDLYMKAGKRAGLELLFEGPNDIGQWPERSTINAALKLSQVLGETPSWQQRISTPSVVEYINERSQILKFDQEIAQRLLHLQMVCTNPQLSLKIEHERLQTSRARRIPARAIADLVSHPGEWESRTLSGIEPKRILSRVMEDEWNIYENRLAARLVDHLIQYLNKRVSELIGINKIIKKGQDYSNNIEKVNYRVAKRITTLWGKVFESDLQETVENNINILSVLRNKVMALLDSSLYVHVSSHFVPTSIKSTNLFSHHPHYRQVSYLWRLWVKYGYERLENKQELIDRRTREALSWDQFVLQLLSRATHALGWEEVPKRTEDLNQRKNQIWILQHKELPQTVMHSLIKVTVTPNGIICLSSDSFQSKLKIVPICTDLSKLSENELTTFISFLDKSVTINEELLFVWVGDGSLANDLCSRTLQARLNGWTSGNKSAVMALSPMMIDAEEKISRVFFSWLSRSVYSMSYPTLIEINKHTLNFIKDMPKSDTFKVMSRGEYSHLLAFSPLKLKQREEIERWFERSEKKLNAEQSIRKKNRLAIDVGPKQALKRLKKFITQTQNIMSKYVYCPVCFANPERTEFISQPSSSYNGENSTWKAFCGDCFAQWTLRLCTINQCNHQYLALLPNVENSVENTRGQHLGWEDQVVGREAWALPCSIDKDHFTCPKCNQCSCEICNENPS